MNTGHTIAIPNPTTQALATPANRFRLTNQVIEVLPCDESSRKRRSAFHKPLDSADSAAPCAAECTRANSASAARLARRRAFGAGVGAFRFASIDSIEFSFI